MTNPPENESAASPRVSLKGCPDYDPERMRDAVRALLEPLGGLKAFVGPDQSVLLKPNLILPRPAESAVMTHPALVRAVAQEVIEAGGLPFVGDSPAFSSARGVAEACGVADVARELGMKLVDLSRRPRVCEIDPEGGFPRAALSALALDADVIINLPKIKAHSQVTMSLGVKNMFGAVAGKRKALFHFRTGRDIDRFSRMLVAVCRYLRPALTIADGVVVLERSGPTHGDPRPVGILVGSADAVALDHVVCDLLNVDAESVPYLRAARRMDGPGFDPNRIEVVGDDPETLRDPGFVQVERFTPIDFSLPRVIKSAIRQVGYLLKARKLHGRGK